MQSRRRMAPTGSASYMVPEDCRDHEDHRDGPKERTVQRAACSARPERDSLLPRHAAPCCGNGPRPSAADGIKRRKYQSRVRNLEPISSGLAPALRQMRPSYIHVCEECRVEMGELCQVGLPYSSHG